MVKRVVFICAAALLLLWPGRIAAQQTRQGEIRGRVADTSGNPVPDVTVIVRNTTTGTQHEANTDQNGEFLITGIEPGRYALQGQSGQNTVILGHTNVDIDTTSNVSIQWDANGDLEVRAETQVGDRSSA